MGMDMAGSQSFHLEQKIQAGMGDAGGKKHLGCQAGKRSNSAIDHDLANTKYTGQAIGMYVMGGS